MTVQDDEAKHDNLEASTPHFNSGNICKIIWIEYMSLNFSGNLHLNTHSHIYSYNAFLTKYSTFTEFFDLIIILNQSQKLALHVQCSLIWYMTRKHES